MPDQAKKKLRNRVSQLLPTDSALFIRARAMFNIGEFMLSNPGDVVSRSYGAIRRPGLNRLHLFFRHVHTRHNARSREPDKQRPPWFSHEGCLVNLLSTLDGSAWADRVIFTVVYDGSESDYTTDFIGKYASTPHRFPFSVKLVNGGSNIKSWLELLAMVQDDAIPDDDVLFFVENDYLHLPGWLDKVVELYNSKIQFDYLSLYDHTDFYELEDKPSFPVYRGLSSEIHVTRSHHWRTAPSTCGTFLVQKRIFVQDLEVWASRLSDFYAFMYLRAIKGRVLLNPVPGLSTHCMQGFLAPTIDWSSIGATK